MTLKQALLLFAVGLGPGFATACTSDAGQATQRVASSSSPDSRPPESLPVTVATPPRPDVSSFVSEGEPLPDGLYFGFLHSVDADGGALAFDLAQHFIGAAANSAESEDGADQLDGYTRNPTEATRTLPVSPDVIVTHLQGTTEGVPGTLAGLAASFGPGAPEHPTLNDEYRGPSGHYWLTVRDGRVARIDEAYHS